MMEEEAEQTKTQLKKEIAHWTSRRTLTPAVLQDCLKRQKEDLEKMCTFSKEDLAAGRLHIEAMLTRLSIGAASHGEEGVLEKSMQEQAAAGPSCAAPEPHRSPEMKRPSKAKLMALRSAEIAEEQNEKEQTQVVMSSADAGAVPGEAPLSVVVGEPIGTTSVFAALRQIDPPITVEVVELRQLPRTASSMWVSVEMPGEPPVLTPRVAPANMSGGGSCRFDFRHEFQVDPAGTLRPTLLAAMRSDDYSEYEKDSEVAAPRPRIMLTAFPPRHPNASHTRSRLALQVLFRLKMENASGLEQEVGVARFSLAEVPVATRTGAARRGCLHPSSRSSPALAHPGSCSTGTRIWSTPRSRWWQPTAARRGAWCAQCAGSRR
jgi:hypothetical protein